MAIGFAGSSNTYNPWGYRTQIQSDLILTEPLYIFTFENIAANGWATFPNLVNFSDLSGDDVIVLDQSNDGSDDLPEFEAFVRKCAGTSQRLLIILNPTWSVVSNDQVNTPANQTAYELQEAVCVAYGISYVDGWQLCIDHVAGGGDLSDYFKDTVHWDETGGAPVVVAAADAILPAACPIPTLLDRIHAASVDYENNPVIKNGTDYDSRTGTWADAGTSTSSNEVDATITYSGTFRKFGCYRADATYPAVTISIDGGAFFSIAFYPNGYDIGVRNNHTVTIKVITSCKIDEFWAI